MQKIKVGDIVFSLAFKDMMLVLEENKIFYHSQYENVWIFYPYKACRMAVGGDIVF